MSISWLKLDVNILDNSKIKIIRSYPDGNTIILLWIGILCLAMKSQRPGVIEISDGMPYDIEDLSKLFDIEKKTVELGLTLFRKYNMISVFNGGTIEVINFSNMQSIEKIERTRELTKIRTAKYRERLQLPAPDDICDADVTRHSVTVTLTDKIRKEEIRKENKQPSADFVLFWKLYPEKKDKAKSEIAFNKIKNRPPIDIILEAVRKQIEWRETANGDFRPKWKYPTTWLNGRCWEDEITCTEEPKQAWEK
jgi:predicted phage replisome organizer